MATIVVNELNPWPLLPPAPRQIVLRLVTAQFCELRKLHETTNVETDLAIDKFWMGIGALYGGKWWTLQAILNKPLYFMMEAM